MYYMWINKNLVHQVGDQTKVSIKYCMNLQLSATYFSYILLQCLINREKHNGDALP